MNTSKPKIIILLLVITMQVQAYVPPFANVNSFNKAKEIHASFSFGTSGAEQSLSFALNKESYLFFNSSFSIDSMQVRDVYSKHLFLDLGFGSCMELGRYWRLITTGGYSYAQFGSRPYHEEYFYSYYEYYNVSFTGHRIFVGINYGLKFKIFEIYGGAKITMGDYFSTNLDEQIYLRGKASLEPNLTVKAGFPKIKFIAQVRHSMDVFNNTFFEDAPPENAFISFGIELNINSLNQNK